MKRKARNFISAFELALKDLFSFHSFCHPKVPKRRLLAASKMNLSKLIMPNTSAMLKYALLSSTTGPNFLVIIPMLAVSLTVFVIN